MVAMSQFLFFIKDLWLYTSGDGSWHYLSIKTIVHTHIGKHAKDLRSGWEGVFAVRWNFANFASDRAKLLTSGQFVG